MTAYYNEHDPKAAAWLRELIKENHIAQGEVDERSIVDVRPSDLVGFDQCHFFAGIGGWSLAIRLAGIPDDYPIWTGSCPCQPFSSAGKGGGFADERHLWPYWQWLIQQSRPSRIFGEQVAAKRVEPWIDLVHADLEAMGYAFGCVPFPSASVGAPHIRDRAYWVADTQGWGFSSRIAGSENCAERAHEGGREVQRVRLPEFANVCDANRLANTVEGGWPRQSGCGRPQEPRIAERGDSGRLEHAAGNGWIERGAESNGGSVAGRCGSSGLEFAGRPGPVNGFWRAADWLLCRDGKWRPVETGTSALAHGIPARVGRLRGYGNAINPVQAAEFILASGIAA